MQHHGRHVLQVRQRLPAWSDGLHANHLAGLHQQLRQSGYLYDFQSGVSQGFQEDHAHGVITRLRSNNNKNYKYRNNSNNRSGAIERESEALVASANPTVSVLARRTLYSR